MPKLPAAAQLAIERYGKRTRIIESTPTISATAPGTEVFRNNPARLAWGIFNGGTSFISVTRRVAPTTTLGARVGSAGGVATEDAEEVGEVVGLPVRAIADTADQQVYAYEIVADVEPDEGGIA